MPRQRIQHMRISHILILVSVMLSCAERPVQASLIAADPSLAPYAAAADARLYRATGLNTRGVSVSFGVCSQPNHAAEYDARWGDVVMCYGTEESFWNVALTHEFMHALGAKHHEGRGVLEKAISPDQCLTSDDVEAVCAVADCRWRAPEC